MRHFRSESLHTFTMDSQYIDCCCGVCNKAKECEGIDDSQEICSNCHLPFLFLRLVECQSCERYICECCMVNGFRCILEPYRCMIKGASKDDSDSEFACCEDCGDKVLDKMEAERLIKWRVKT